MQTTATQSLTKGYLEWTRQPGCNLSWLYAEIARVAAWGFTNMIPRTKHSLSEKDLAELRANGYHLHMVEEKGIARLVSIEWGERKTFSVRLPADRGESL